MISSSYACATPVARCFDHAHDLPVGNEDLVRHCSRNVARLNREQPTDNDCPNRVIDARLRDGGRGRLQKVDP